MPIVWTSWSLSLLEPSGPVQACNGIALPLRTVIKQAKFTLEQAVKAQRDSFPDRPGPSESLYALRYIDR